MSIRQIAVLATALVIGTSGLASAANYGAIAYGNGYSVVHNSTGTYTISFPAHSFKHVRSSM